MLTGQSNFDVMIGRIALISKIKVFSGSLQGAAFKSVVPTKWSLLLQK